MKKPICSFIIALIINSLLFPYLSGHAASLSNGDIVLPKAGLRVALSKAFMPVMLKGVVVDPKDPFKFNFIVDSGDTGLKTEQLNEQGMTLVKYFLAALTVPEEEMWVNLSPYEKNRIISKSFGSTEMGRDLLAQDYLLKQLSASLTYPEEALGKKFWDQVYQKVQQEYGAVEIPMNVINKVWIMPDKAQVYEHKNGAFVVEGKLKVMLEEDYLAVSKNQRQPGDISPSEMCHQDGCQAKSGMHAKAPQGNYRMRTVPSQIIREIILPQLEKEVNEGEHFSSLRQAYQSMILASWYKIRLKESILGKLYVNQGKTDGVTLKDQTANQKIYEQYIQAFKKGVYNYIKDTPDVHGQNLPKKYFSGGMTVMHLENLVGASLMNQNTAMRAQVLGGKRGALSSLVVKANLHTQNSFKEDSAMITEVTRTHIDDLKPLLDQLSNLDLIDHLSGQAQEIENDIANNIEQRLKEFFRVIDYKPSYFELHVEIDAESQYVGLIPKFIVTLKNHENADNIAVNVISLNERYKNLKKALTYSTSWRGPMLDGMIVLTEVEDHILTRATTKLKGNNPWEIKFTVGFKDQAMGQNTMGLGSVNFKHNFHPSFTKLIERYVFKYLTLNPSSRSANNFKVYIQGTGDDDWKNRLFEDYINEILGASSESLVSPKVISFMPRGERFGQVEMNINEFLLRMQEDPYIVSNNYIFNVIRMGAEYLSDGSAQMVNLKQLSQYVQSNLGVDYKDSFKLAIDNFAIALFPDSAMKARDNLGGIDLNVKNLDLLIQRDANGFVLPVSSQPLDQIHINGLFPVILSITAVSNLHDFLN